MEFKVPKILTERAREFRKEPTDAEKRLWAELKGRRLGGYKFRRQQPIERVVVDFVCLELNLVIEVDGEIHESQQKYDQARDEFLESLGLKTIRFRNEQILNEIDSVKAAILRACSERLTTGSSTLLSPSPSGRG